MVWLYDASGDGGRRGVPGGLSLVVGRSGEVVGLGKVVIRVVMVVGLSVGRGVTVIRVVIVVPGGGSRVGRVGGVV